MQTVLPLEDEGMVWRVYSQLTLTALTLAFYSFSLCVLICGCANWGRPLKEVKVEAVWRYDLCKVFDLDSGNNFRKWFPLPKLRPDFWVPFPTCQHLSSWEWHLKINFPSNWTFNNRCRRSKNAPKNYCVTIMAIILDSGPILSLRYKDLIDFKNAMKY